MMQVPPWLETPRVQGRFNAETAGRLAAARDIACRPEEVAAIARDVEAWVAEDFREACAELFSDVDASRVAAESVVDLGPDAALLFHATLVGLALGASRDAFARARTRDVAGRPLIEHELIAARLSGIATDVVVAELQFQQLCDLAVIGDRGDEQELSRRETERAALSAVIESAHVFGGHGFLVDHDPGHRVEIAHSLMSRLGELP